MADAKEIIRLLLERGQTLCTAESCTGGLVSAAITAVPGASAVFLGGAAAYAYSAKERILGVRADLLQTHGAVSEVVAREMATGARAAFGADYAVSITGIAGPGGGMPGKPVGLVWIAAEGPDGAIARSFVFPGDRDAVRAASVEAAFELLKEVIA
jgi:nicotinamide-nucleotide amidase